MNTADIDILLGFWWTNERGNGKRASPKRPLAVGLWRGSKLSGHASTGLTGWEWGTWVEAEWLFRIELTFKMENYNLRKPPVFYFSVRYLPRGDSSNNITNEKNDCPTPPRLVAKFEQSNRPFDTKENGELLLSCLLILAMVVMQNICASFWHAGVLNEALGV